MMKKGKEKNNMKRHFESKYSFATISLDGFMTSVSLTCDFPFKSTEVGIKKKTK